jgi:hypothetical protein
MQCPIGDAARGHPVGEIEAVKLSYISCDGYVSMSRFWWKVLLQNGNREGSPWLSRYELQEPYCRPERVDRRQCEPEIRTILRVFVCLRLGIFLLGVSKR